MPSELVSVGGVLAALALIAWTWLMGAIGFLLLGGLLEEWDILPPCYGGGWS